MTLSIITKDRPQSLSRLLESITDAKFFGDKIDLRVNMEQSSDMNTRNIIKSFRWSYGSMFVHHRVIHGGLLTAVAESWYPHSQDAYGVLLEDDVELSPLFYAWIKMTLLRYRWFFSLSCLEIHSLMVVFLPLGTVQIEARLRKCSGSVYISRKT